MAASPEPNPRQLYEFGSFRLDAEKELLLREDETVPIAPKAFQILLVLIRHNKQLVTKDDLLKTIWPETFVEEANLSRNIFLLRKALGESPQDHQYIITVPGRGYRFAEDVQLVPRREVNIVAAAHSTIEVEVEETRPWGWIAAAALLLIALSIGARKFFADRTPVLTEKDTVVLADFTNSTGDSVFDDTLRQGLSVELEQTPFIQLVSDDQIAQTLRLMEKSPQTRLTPVVAREACRRANATADIEGSIAALGNQYVIGLNAVDCRSGETLAREQVSVSGKESVLTALGRATSKLRAKLGETRVSLERFDTPLAEATTPSLEALRAYTLGVRAMDGADPLQASSFFLQAIRLDPDFAMAYARLGTNYKNLGELDLGIENTHRAYQLHDRVSEQEKLYIDSHFYQLATGDLERARQVFELWAQTYPRNSTPRINLGVVYEALGQYDKSLEEYREARRMHPSALVYTDIARTYLHLNRLEEARSTAGQVQADKSDSPSLQLLLYDLAFLEGDAAGMKDQSSLVAEWPGMENSQADTAAYFGRLAEARNLSRLAVTSAERGERPELAAAYEANSALREALLGNAAEVRNHTAAALSLSDNRNVQFEAALALAFIGDRARSQQLADDLDKRFPDDTVAHCNYLPSVRAQLALNNKDSSKAIETLQTAIPCELGVPGSTLPRGALYPAYVRGEADLEAHHGRDATVEFQKILDHSGIILNEPIGVLAHLGLAHAYALSGEPSEARTQYQEFFALWKNADPDCSILKGARAEYAKLQ